MYFILLLSALSNRIKYNHVLLFYVSEASILNNYLSLVRTSFILLEYETARKQKDKKMKKGS